MRRLLSPRSSIAFAFTLLGLAAFARGGLFAAEPIPGAAEPIPVEKYAALRAVLAPAEAEQQWLKIPWGLSLWEARRQAAREGKPILLWEMDGHPLGCT